MNYGRDTYSKDIELELGNPDSRNIEPHNAIQVASSGEMLALTDKLSKDDSLNKVESFRATLGEKGLDRYSVVEIRSEDAREQERLMEIPEEYRESMANFEIEYGEQVLAVAPVDGVREDGVEYVGLVQGEHGVYTRTFGATKYAPVN